MDEEDSADATGSSGDVLATTSVSGPASASSMPAGTDESTTTTGITTAQTDGSSTTDDTVEGVPVCLEHLSFGITALPPHHADVDGDGAAELWTVTGSDPSTVTAYLPTMKGAALAHQTERAGSSFGFADIDGDGRDDLVVSGEFTLEWFAGQPDGSLSEEGAPITVTGAWGFTLADADGDGDDDLFRVQSGTPVELEVLENDAGSFAVVSSQLLPDHVDAAAAPVGARVREAGTGVVLQLDWPADGNDDGVILDVRLEPDGVAIDEILASDVASYRVVGEADVDGDADLEILAERYEAPAAAIVYFDPSGGSLVEQVFLDNAAYAVVGDLEGTGTRQLLYRFDDEPGEPWATRFFRFEDGTDAEVLVEDDFGVPIFRHDFDYDLDTLDEAYVEYCEFVCTSGMAELVPC